MGGDARPPLPSRLEAHLEDTGLIRPDDAVLVACSGGLDSIALLHLLRFGLPGYRLDLRAAHLDHAMRPSSAGDAAWIRGLCRAWDVPLVSERAAEAPSSETEARRIRYAFLHRVARDLERVATAHHADDQAETLLFRMIRGTGLRGLRGIPARRGPIIRPLLPFRRADLATYADRVGLAYRDDPSNRDLRMARNRIRHRVLPELERIRPGAVMALVRLARHAERAERGWQAVLDRLGEQAILESDETGVTLARSVLRSYHPQVRAGVLRHVLRRYGSTPDRAGTHAALEFISSGRSGGGLDLPGNVRLERDFDRFRVARVSRGIESTGADDPLVIGSSAPGQGTATIGGRVLDVAWGASVRGAVTEGEKHARFHGRLAYPLTLRGWRPGDRIRLDYGSKKLKKLFAEHRLDRRARARVPLLVDDTGQVLWAVGLAHGAEGTEDGEALEITVVDAEQR